MVSDAEENRNLGLPSGVCELDRQATKNSLFFIGLPRSAVATHSNQETGMPHVSVRTRILALATMSAVTLLVACGEDKRTKELNTGITRDSAVSVMAQGIKGGGRDSFPNVYDRARYLINGQTYEVLYFTPENKKFSPENKKKQDSVRMSDLTPIVFLDNKLVGKGWPAWDSISKANKIPLVDHSKK